MNGYLRRRLVCLTCFVATAFFHHGLSANTTEDLKLSISSGRISGVAEEGIRVFRGIPYAAPPIGELRWAAPQAPLSWQGVRDASDFGPWCPQPDFQAVQSLSKAGGELAARTRTTGGFLVISNTPMVAQSAEDCLTLNVWTPPTARKAPVMVWLHGGTGSGAQPYYNGTRFAQDGVVLVTINFRLWSLGRFAHPALTAAATADEPLGLYFRLDQIAALKWVRDNIAQFGGDPDNVTLFGQSAGGAATLGLLATPAAKGLFHKAIVQSSSGFWSPLSHEDHETFGSLLAAEAGLPGKKATLEQLRALAPDALPWAGMGFLDGRWWAESKHDAIAAGRINDIPLIIGWNSFDGSSLRYATEKVLADTPNDVIAAYAEEGLQGRDLAYSIYTDRHNGAPARWIAAQTSTGAPSYLYQFSYVGTVVRQSAKGASHGEEIFYIFDTWGKIPKSELPSGMDIEAIMTDDDRAMTRLMRGCWVAFAKTGEPECEGAPSWPRYRAEDDQLMDFGITVQLRQNYRKAQLDAQEQAMDHERDLKRHGAQSLIREMQSEVGG